jgi:hypothetical protein
MPGRPWVNARCSPFLHSCGERVLAGKGRARKLDENYCYDAFGGGMLQAWFERAILFAWASLGLPQGIVKN